jgi:hypothetical protein
MISKPTLFVVGAGASVPYGLPTGAELRAMIYKGIVGRAGALFSRLRECGHHQDDLKQFAEEFLLSGQRSIDAFLARRQEYSVVGKRAIAGVLLPLEKLHNLYGDQTAGPARWGDSDWLGYLWERMSDGVMDPEALGLNKVSFITFNYDRSIETFLLHSIQHTFGIGIDRAWRILSKIPIFHMYGDLGPYEEGAGFHFGADVTEVTVKFAAERLKVMPSTRPDRELACTEAISLALQTIFLGFGFDEMNCARLGFQEIKEDGDGGVVIGTALLATNAERGIAWNRVASPRIQPRLADMTCLQLLRDNAFMLY